MCKELELFLVFAKIGMFTFGGGYAMIAMMEDELAVRRSFISAGDFPELVAASQACPGLFALNMAVFTGMRISGFAGAVFAALGAVLPPFICILLIAACFRSFRDNAYVNRVLMGLRPSAAAMVAVPVFTLARRSGINIRNVWITIAAAILVCLAGISPVYIVIAAIAGGLAAGRLRRK